MGVRRKQTYDVTPSSPAPEHPAAEAAERPKYRLPADAIPPEELALLGKRDPVDVDAALAWLDGTGPDPWQSAGSR